MPGRRRRAGAMAPAGTGAPSVRRGAAGPSGPAVAEGLGEQAARSSSVTVHGAGAIGQRLEDGDADRGHAERHGEAACRGHRDAQPGEVAGAGTDAEAVEAGQPRPASASISSSIGSSRSAWPRSIASSRAAIRRAREPERPRNARPRCRRRGSAAASEANRANLGDLRDVVAEQVLDAHLQRHRRGRAAGAGALHVQVDDAAVEAVEGDVAAVLRHRRADPGVEQLLDLADDLGVRPSWAAWPTAPASPSITGWPDWKCSMIAPRMPGLMWAQSTVLGLGHGHEVGAEEHPGHAVGVEDAPGERRGLRRGLGAGKSAVPAAAPPGRAGTSGSPGSAWTSVWMNICASGRLAFKCARPGGSQGFWNPSKNSGGGDDVFLGHRAGNDRDRHAQLADAAAGERATSGPGPAFRYRRRPPARRSRGRP